MDESGNFELTEQQKILLRAVRGPGPDRDLFEEMRQQYRQLLISRLLDSDDGNVMIMARDQVKSHDEFWTTVDRTAEPEEEEPASPRPGPPGPFEARAATGIP